MWPPVTATADKKATDFQNVPWLLVAFPLESLHSLNLFILFFLLIQAIVNYLSLLKLKMLQVKVNLLYFHLYAGLPHSHPQSNYVQLLSMYHSRTVTIY